MLCRQVLVRRHSYPESLSHKDRKSVLIRRFGDWFRGCNLRWDDNWAVIKSWQEATGLESLLERPEWLATISSGSREHKEPIEDIARLDDVSICDDEFGVIERRFTIADAWVSEVF